MCPSVALPFDHLCDSAQREIFGIMSFVQNSKELCHCFVLSVANNLETVSHFAKAILGAQSSDKRSTTKRMTIIIVLCI